MEPDHHWDKNGYFGKFDQGLYTPTTIEEAGLMQWGFYYYPEACMSPDSNCLFQVFLHGAGERAEDGAREWWNKFASSNNIVMIFPQAMFAWDVNVDKRMTGDDNRYFSK